MQVSTWGWNYRNQTKIGKKMKTVPDYIVKDLLRLLPILIENVDLVGKSTRVQNAVRLVKNIVKKLSKID